MGGSDVQCISFMPTMPGRDPEAWAHSNFSFDLHAPTTYPTYAMGSAQRMGAFYEVLNGWAHSASNGAPVPSDTALRVHA